MKTSDKKYIEFQTKMEDSNLFMDETTKGDACYAYRCL